MSETRRGAGRDANHRRTFRGSVGWGVTLTGVYFLAAIVGIAATRQPDHLAAIWIANALALTFLVKADRRVWPGGLFAILVASMAANLLMDNPPPTSLAMAGGNLLEIGLGAFVVQTWLGPVFSSKINVLSYLKLQLVAAIAAPAMGGFVAARVLNAVDGAPIDAAWWGWWSASAMGAITVLPIVLTTSFDWGGALTGNRKMAETVAHAVLSTVITYLAVTLLAHPFVVIVLVLMLVALRTGARGTALISAACVAVVSTTVYFGAVAGVPDTGRMFEISVNFFAALTVFPPFCLSLIVEELRREKLRIAESEQRFRNAMEHSAIGMALVGLDGRWLRVNRALTEMLGYPPHEFADLTFQEITHPDDLSADLGLVQETIARKIDSYRMEKRYLRKDGSLVWALLAVSLVRDEHSGAPLYFISQIEDITTRKLAEEAIEKNESRWHFALESARQGVWDYDVKAGKTFYSSVWKGILGYGPDEIDDDARTWWTFVHPDDVELVRTAGREHVANNTPNFECEFRMRHKDGHWVWILDRGKVIERDADGQPLRMIGTHTDITARKETEEHLKRLSQRIQLAVKAGGVGLWERTIATGAIWWDGRMREIYGVDSATQDIDYQFWATRVHPEDRERVKSEIAEAVAGGNPYDTEYRAIRPSGEIRYVRSMASIIRNPDGEPWVVSGTNWDITEHRRLTDALFKEKELLQVTLQSIGDGVITTDTAANVTFMNPIAEGLTGWRAADALGKPVTTVARIVDESTEGQTESPVDECMRLVRPVSRYENVVLVGRAGERRDIRESAAPVRTASGEVVGAVLVFQDMTRSRQLQRQLAHSAAHDALTGLPNRTTFEAELTAACAEAISQRRQHALCFIDLDRFKIVNDTVGHAAGDALLREIGRVIMRTVRANDVTARLGGDEFALLLHDCSMDQAEVVAQHVIEAIRQVPFAWGGRIYDVGASVGITAISESSPTPSELLSQADVACYAAKAMGRNRVAVYSAGESDAHRHHRDLQVAANLRGAIEENHFRLFAQEIRGLRYGDAAVRHVELLLRLDDNGELLEPNSFIPAAERYDLMANIDRWVVRTALRGYGERIRSERDLSISINLSANSLNDPLFWPFLQEELRVTPIPSSQIHIEITETALINNLSAAHALVSAARQAGCVIVLDDFGTGLSSFAYLKRFPVDYVKIDGTFMQNLKDSGVDRAIVESINDIAHKLGARTIAECVEDVETIEVLKVIGVDEVQGFAIAKPVPIEALLRMPQRKVSAA